MIHIQGNEFVPGSLTPKFSPNVGDFDMPHNAQDDMDFYISERGWDRGMNFAIIGKPSTGKTAVGLYLMRMIFKLEPSLANMVYWTEYDFIADMRNQWRYDDLVKGSPKDSALWAESLEWERTFWDYKESPILFLDDLAKVRTVNQRYEVEALLRTRKNMGLSTFVAATTDDWDTLADSVKVMFSSPHSMNVVMEEVVHAGQ